MANPSLAAYAQRALAEQVFAQKTTSLLVVWYWIETDRRVKKRLQVVAAMGEQGVAALKERVFHLQREARAHVDFGILHRLPAAESGSYEPATEERVLAMLTPACERLRDVLSNAGLLDYTGRERRAESLTIDLEAKPYKTLVLVARFRESLEDYRKASDRYHRELTAKMPTTSDAVKDEGWRLWHEA